VPACPQLPPPARLAAGTIVALNIAPHCPLHLHAAAAYKYCQGCSYQKGLCAMCGKQILDTKGGGGVGEEQGGLWCAGGAGRQEVPISGCP
jgi:hypothetical protein